MQAGSKKARTRTDAIADIDVDDKAALGRRLAAGMRAFDESAADRVARGEELLTLADQLRRHGDTELPALVARVVQEATPGAAAGDLGGRASHSPTVGGVLGPLLRFDRPLPSRCIRATMCAICFPPSSSHVIRLLTCSPGHLPTAATAKGVGSLGPGFGVHARVGGGSPRA